MAEYNKDAVRLVKPYVDGEITAAKAYSDGKLAAYIVTSETDPEKGTLGQLAVVAGTLKVCTVAYTPASGDDPAVSATWKAVSHAS